MPDEAKGLDAAVKLTGSSSEPKPRRRRFPGPAGAREMLRVWMSGDAYAELIAHAKASPAVEVCGVLAGEWCEDEQGGFVVVEASIRGNFAKQGATHVTFTQETWNEIHKQIDAKHAERQIVGWYHTHPGFGVEFSGRDLFIQRNFFRGPGQIAFLVDPIRGEEAILVNDKNRVAYLARFWVEMQERRLRVTSPES